MRLLLTFSGSYLRCVSIPSRTFARSLALSAAISFSAAGEKIISNLTIVTVYLTTVDVYLILTNKRLELRLASFINAVSAKGSIG